MFKASKKKIWVLPYAEDAQPALSVGVMEYISEYLGCQGTRQHPRGSLGAMACIFNGADSSLGVVNLKTMIVCKQIGLLVLWEEKYVWIMLSSVRGLSRFSDWLIYYYHFLWHWTLIIRG